MNLEELKENMAQLDKKLAIAENDLKKSVKTLKGYGITMDTAGDHLISLKKKYDRFSKKKRVLHGKAQRLIEGMEE